MLRLSLCTLDLLFKECSSDQLALFIVSSFLILLKVYVSINHILQLFVSLFGDISPIEFFVSDG